MLRTLFVNKNYAGPSIDILPASFSSSMINRSIECINRPNVIPDPVYNVAHASSEDPKDRSYNNVEFYPLSSASNDAQIFKTLNCLNYSTTKKRGPLSHACTVAPN